MEFSAKALLETKGDHVVPMTGRLDRGVDPRIEENITSGDTIDAEKARKFLSQKDPGFGMKIVEGTLKKGVDVDIHSPITNGGNVEKIKLDI